MECHNDRIAVGKTKFGTFTHIATNSDCGACHSTTTFTTATSFNHTGVTTGCAASGCHMSGTPSVVDVTDDPNPLPHIPIANGSVEVNCYSCHKNAGGTFANALMDHSVVTFAACQSCHDGNHDGSNVAHIVTAQVIGALRHYRRGVRFVSYQYHCLDTGRGHHVQAPSQPTWLYPRGPGDKWQPQHDESENVRSMPHGHEGGNRHDQRKREHLDVPFDHLCVHVCRLPRH